MLSRSGRFFSDAKCSGPLESVRGAYVLLALALSLTITLLPINSSRSDCVIVCGGGLL